MLEHTPYSPDIASCDVSCSQMQIRAARRNFGDVTTIKSEMTSLLKGLSEAKFQECLKQRKQWDKCIVSNGKYFEGDEIDVAKNF